MSTWVHPTTSDFKARFVRDFPYAPENDSVNTEYVMDADITQAMKSAVTNFNPSIGADNDGLIELFLLLTAFYLVQNLKSAAKGIFSQAEFAMSSKGVGSGSVGLAIPEDYLKNPLLAQFTSNAYGMQYLTMAFPYIIGNVRLSCGGTTFA